MHSGLLYIIFLAVSSTLAYKKGIDVSHWQGIIDWTKVKASGIDFVILKATEGSGYVDPTLYQNWKAVKCVGLQKGVYHFLRGSSSAKSQIQLIKNTLKNITFDVINDIIAIDIEQKRNEEVGPEKMTNILHDVLEDLKNALTNIYIYTSPNYWENQVAWRKYDFSKYKLWLAHYTRKTPTIPTTWKNKGYTLWQYSDRGSVNGIKGEVDLDRGI